MEMEKLISILKDLHPDVDYGKETELIDGGILTSLDIVALISEINDAFDISIPAHEIRSENFNSAAAIMRLVDKLREREL